MESIKFSVAIAAPAERVMHHFWELESWPSIAPHVRGIDMHYRDETIQVLTMRVATGKRQDSFKSVRVRQPNGIFFYQPAPPAALRKHYGWWQLAAGGEFTTVTSEHVLEIDLEQASWFLAATGNPAEGSEQVREAFRKIIHHNSFQTMMALKRCLEEERGESHALPG